MHATNTTDTHTCHTCLRRGVLVPICPLSSSCYWSCRCTADQTWPSHTLTTQLEMGWTTDIMTKEENLLCWYFLLNYLSVFYIKMPKLYWTQTASRTNQIACASWTATWFDIAMDWPNSWMNICHFWLFLPMSTTVNKRTAVFMVKP